MLVKAAAIAGVLALSAGGVSNAATKAGDVEATMTIGGRERTYLVHVPESAKPGMPAVIALHGRLGTGAEFAKGIALNQLADKYGFIAVYPDGYKRSWNDGRTNVTPANKDGVDDVAFVSALIDAMAKEYKTRRTFALGASNGGMMSQRLACDLSGRLAGVATVIGQMPKSTTCRPSRPVPMLMINGTADPIVPYEGGEVGGQGPDSTVLSVKDTLAFWLKANHCHGRPVTRKLPDKADDGTTTTVTTSQNCRVTEYTVTGGGHTWPGADYTPPAGSGPVSRDFSASEVIWKFFATIPGKG